MSLALRSPGAMGRSVVTGSSINCSLIEVLFVASNVFQNSVAHPGQDELTPEDESFR